MHSHASAQPTQEPLALGLASPVVYMEGGKHTADMLRARIAVKNPENIPACVIVIENRDESFTVTALATWSSE
jgi:hypothetical protein